MSFLLNAHVESAGALAGKGCGEFIRDAAFGLRIDAKFTGFAAQQAFNPRIAFKPLRKLGQLGRHAGNSCPVALLLKLLARCAQSLPVADKALGSQRRIGAYGGFVLHGYRVSGRSRPAL